MLRPYPIPLEQRAKLSDRLSRSWPRTSEQRALEEQEASIAHRRNGAPFASLGKPRCVAGVGQDSDPMWIARCDRFERDLGRRRGDVIEDVAGSRVSRELSEIAALADDDRGIVPDDKGKGGGGCGGWWRLARQ